LIWSEVKGEGMCVQLGPKTYNQQTRKLKDKFIYLLLERQLKWNSFLPFHFTKTKENFYFYSASWNGIHFISWSWLKIYYNSISRQSGIVHKDKAMRQLDLDLWEMNW